MSGKVRAVGLDFGTTNSAIAIVGEDGAPRLAQFPSEDGALIETFRSILFFEAVEETGSGEAVLSAGNDAIRRYLTASGQGRLIQSLKSFLADSGFETTEIMGEQYSLGDLIAPILAELRRAAEAQFGELPERVVAGRPVHFSGGDAAGANELARRRLDIAIRRAGWSEVVFEYEPIGAAYDYARRIARAELALIADFGGGTSDFSLLRLAPGADSRRHEILGNDGVAIAGDAFDGSITRHLAAPALGRGSMYRTPYGEVLPVSTWPYTKLERWHLLSLLRARETMHKLRRLCDDALEPEKIAALVHIVENDLGYYLFRSVEAAKLALSDRETATFHFADPPNVEIESPIARREFEDWIARYLREIAECVDGLLANAGVGPAKIDSVFLTGGSSFVPAVRRIFADRFGADRLRMGNEFTSVARGLALRALDGA
ncbi:MAG: Hsp70 family protein [Candidatus Binataceae bacterium]